MYFPSDMNFQYFFFSTYPGFFLQALPIALIAGIIYAARQIRRGRRRSTGRIILSSLFVCYITGLLCLTLLNSIIGDIYYFLFYNAPSGRSHHWFTFEYDFIPEIAGFVTTLGIELLQPVFGRSFDINDIILNCVGVTVSTVAFYTLKMIFTTAKNQTHEGG